MASKSVSIAPETQAAHQAVNDRWVGMHPVEDGGSNMVTKGGG